MPRLTISTAAAFLTAFLALLCLPATAGHYTISYQYGGQAVPPLAYSTFTISPTSGSAALSITVTTTLTWVKDTQTETPPLTVSFVERGSVVGGGATRAPVVHGLVSPVVTVSDGLGDAAVTTTSTATDLEKSSQGCHVTQQAWAQTITLRRTLSFTFGCDSAHSDAGNGGVNISYEVLVNATVGGHSTVDTSAVGNPWDAQNPRFFSGTNCSASGTAQAFHSCFVTHAQLLVGGTAVKDYYDTAVTGHPVAGANVALGTNQSSATLTVYFDSTHFADATTVLIQMIVNDSGGNTYNSTIKANAENEGYVGYEPTTVSGQTNAGVVDTVMSACQIGDNDSSVTDNRDAVLSAVKSNTVFFTCNHGDESPDANNHIYFEAPAGVGNMNGLIYGDNSVDQSSTKANPRDDVAQAVAKKSVDPPPYNFVYLDVCNSALNTEFSAGFGIPSSGALLHKSNGITLWHSERGHLVQCI